MYRVTRKTTGMKRPRITARKAPKDTSRPMVPPSTATTPASVSLSCAIELVSRDMLGELASFETAILLCIGRSAGCWTNASTAARHANARVSSAQKTNRSQ
uniref:Uncharacterized protein n=1 Tax=Chrysotila carterae TaxID=13221 RepID=A0A7S4AZA3_CHRCT